MLEHKDDTFIFWFNQAEEKLISPSLRTFPWLYKIKMHIKNMLWFAIRKCEVRDEVFPGLKTFLTGYY